MTYKIIQTENYLLVVDKNRPTGWYYNETDNRVDSAESTPTVIGGTIVHNIIAHLPLNNSPILEGVDLLPSIEDDVEQMINNLLIDKYGVFSSDQTVIKTGKAAFKDGFKEGYNKAKEKYKYTEKDIMSAMKYAVKYYSHMWDDSDGEKIIQSLQQPKMPIGFNLEAKDTHIQNGVLVKSQWVGEYIY